ncbi:hypothetical protein [Bdellovibrio sp. KM01]|uniref:hypothetical protein n=1 Tax=Bdellovibrio sp. KM01 TaxID=2748865 RepID=UPI0015EA9D9A|nr:hypothetical protein [Bdellovibrio sp. KM01]QLY24119.1 hypothetical protein HW988_11630 [Bdellovibrio sp. KM01]
MQKNIVGYLFTLFSLFLLMGCSDADPKVSFLRPMDTFEFKPTNSVVTSTLTTISLKAECSRFINNVDLSFDGGTTWFNSSTYDASYVICSTDGEYKITLSNSKPPMSTMTINNGDSFTVKFRATSRSGNQIVKDVNIRFVPPAQIKQAILAGASVQTATGLVLRGRILSHKQDTASGGGYKIWGRVAE